MERTLVLVKPDAMQRGLAGEVISRIERRGLKIIGAKLLAMDQGLAQRHYAVHKEKAFFQDLVGFITSSPILALVVEGNGAIEATRQTMGATDPKKAAPGSIRADLATDIGRNLVHGSDGPESAREEIALFFREGELVEYSRDLDRWVTES